MPLPFLFTVPNSMPELRRWFFWNAADHLEIQQAVQKQKSINMVVRVLDPVDLRSIELWSEQHQQAHNDANNAIGLNGTDLTDFSLKNREKLREFIFSNAQEHQAMRQSLGI